MTILKTVGATALILLVWMGIFWVAVHSIESAARPPSIDRRPFVEAMNIGEDGAPLDGGRTFRVTPDDHGEFSVDDETPAARVRFLIPFSVESPTTPHALYISVRSMTVAASLNGVQLQNATPLQRVRGRLSSEPVLYLFPESALQRGVNALTVDMLKDGRPKLSTFSIGPADKLESAYRVRSFLQVDIALIGFGILLFAILLCLVVRWPLEDLPRVVALLLLLGSCAASTYLLGFSPSEPWSLFDAVFIFSLSQTTTAVAIIAYALADFAAPSKRYKVLSGSWLVVALLLWCCAYAARTFGPADAWLRGMYHGSLYLAIGAGLFGFAMLAWLLVRTKGVRAFERSVLALCFAAFVVDAWGTLVELRSPFDRDLPLSLTLLFVVGVLLGLSLIVAIAREASEARRVVVNANVALREKLAVKERELAEGYAQREAIQRRAAILEERQRIVRDMHDGIGGQLLGLKVQVHARQIDAAGLEAALDTSITDMRLIVDSLDLGDDSLLHALRAFETRVRPQVRAAGCEFIAAWGDIGDAPHLGPRGTLQVMRILQEAVSNALRHASPRTIRMVNEPITGGVRLSVADDGTGIQGEPRGGRGLANMRHRAKDIGGELSIISGEAGTTVTLDLHTRER